MRALLVAICLVLLPTASRAAVYEWSGICSFGCTGTATATLTLADGAAPFNFNWDGSPPNVNTYVDTGEFISFQYQSSSGTFFLDNTPSGLYAQGYIYAPSPGIFGGITFLENGELGPQTSGTPLFQFVVFRRTFGANVEDTWSLIIGRYGDTCLNEDCSLSTYDVREGGGISEFVTVSAIPEPSTWAMMMLGFIGVGFLVFRSRCGRKLAT